MCVGAPVTVLSVNGLVARCIGAAGLEDVDLCLVGEVAEGAHLLTHLGVAMRIIDADEFTAIGDALEAVRRASRGEPFEDLLADLINRTPELPAHLRQEQ